MGRILMYRTQKEASTCDGKDTQRRARRVRRRGYVKTRSSMFSRRTPECQAVLSELCAVSFFEQGESHVWGKNWKHGILLKGSNSSGDEGLSFGTNVRTRSKGLTQGIF